MFAALQGLHRWPKECFRLLGRRGQGDWTVLPQPWSSYRADPFLWEWQGEMWVFFEEFEYLRNKGRIAVCRLDGSGYGGVLDEPDHLSYPFLFRWQERLWMIPESCARRTVDLYECMEFPYRWVRRSHLLLGLDAADSTLVQLEERWWLFTSVRPVGSEQRHLEIYSSLEPQGPWLAHPVNQRRLYGELANSCGRGGGGFFSHQGRWIRPAQYSPQYYGQGLALMQLQQLSLEDFAEKPVTFEEYPWRWNHHLSLWGEHQWTDRKTRRAYWTPPEELDCPWTSS